MDDVEFVYFDLDDTLRVLVVEERVVQIEIYKFDVVH